MAPPKWTVFDGLDDAGEDPQNTDEQTNAAGESADTEGASETLDSDASGDAGSESANAGGSAESEAGEDPKEEDGDGDKPDKSGRLICAGALCTCTNAVSPTPLPLNVTTQEKHTVNDPDGTIKYLATNKETDKTSLHFGMCKFPDPSKPVPCNAQLVWKDFYEPIVLPGGAHPLLQSSTAFCTVGQGTVAFRTSGQQATVTPEQVAAANSAGWQSENPLAGESDAEVEMEADETGGDDTGVGVVSIKAKTAGPYAVDSTLVFEVTKLSKPREKCTPEQLRGINWMVYDKDLKPYAQAIDSGEETDIKFKKAGRYTVEAYGGSPGADSKDKKAKKGSAIVTLTIEENKLSGIKRVGGSGSLEYRFEEPAIYELSTLFPTDTVPLPRRQTLETGVWQVTKKAGVGEPVLVPAGVRATVTCTAPCEYIVQATLGDTTQQTGLMKAIKNGVTAVTVNPKSCRPGEEVTLKALFKIDPPLPAELALLKWLCKDAKGMEHKESFAPGVQVQKLRLKPVGHYKVWAFVSSPSKTVVAGFEVTQPRVKSVQWLYSDKVTPKRVTGWEEESSLLLGFESAQGLEAEVTPGIVREGTFQPLMKAARITLKGNTDDTLYINLTREHFAGKIKEGDSIVVSIRCVTAGQHFQAEGIFGAKLLFTEKEVLEGLAFYKGGERVNQAQYGDALKCRVYGRNVSAGTAGVRVVVGRYEPLLKGGVPQFGELLADKTVVIGELGYGEFDFYLDGSKAVGSKLAIHKFGALLWENEAGSVPKVILPEDAKRVQMLFVPAPVKAGSGAPSPAEIGRGEVPPAGGCVCKDYDLIWGAKVSCEFRRKVVEICRELWPGNFMEMANGLMAVIAAETDRSFAAHQIMGKRLKPIAEVTKDDFYKINTKGEITGSRAVGLIQFTQRALESLKDFVKGTGYDKLHEVKLQYAEMGEVRQLEEKVKAYFKLNDANKRIKTPEDIYLHVFAPIGVGKGDSAELYRHYSKPSNKKEEESDEGYSSNKSVDDDGNKDGIIQRSEILARYKLLFSEGLGKKGTGTCAFVNDKIEPDSDFDYEYVMDSKNNIQKIYHNTDFKSGESKIQYSYVDKKGISHMLGKFTLHITAEMMKGNIPGTRTVHLLDVREFSGYNGDGVTLKFVSFNTDSGRYFINPDCFAALLGAMASMNTTYIGFNGFSDKLGRSVGGSSSHINGEKGDLRYISLNRNGERTLLQDKHFDVAKQNEFNDKLYDFGWARTEKMYSEYFRHEDVANYILKHCKHMVKFGAHGYRHHHHIHLTGFDHAKNKIK